MRTLSAQEINNAVLDIRYRGYAVIKGYLDKDRVETTLSLINEDYEKHNYDRDKHSTKSRAIDKQVYHLQAKNIEYLNLITDSNILDLIKPFLNDPYYRNIPQADANFVLGNLQARSSVVPLALHQDNFIVYPGDSHVSMHLVISLNGQNEETGATVIVPGSHLMGTLPDLEYTGYDAVKLSPGDAVIFDSRLWHGALGNNTGMDRWNLLVVFRAWWAKQNFDPVRCVSEELFAAMTPQQKALMGFLSLPALDETEKIAIKEGYDNLLGSIAEYRKRKAY
jgi:hypothetical protein